MELKKTFHNNIRLIRDKYKNIHKYIVPSLKERGERDDWLLNVLIRDIIKNDTRMLENLENFFDRTIIGGKNWTTF